MNITDIQSNTWFFSVSGLVFVLIGWRVVYRNAKKIATRGESKSLVDHLIKPSNEICELSVKFWMDFEGKDIKVQALAYNIAVGAKVSQLEDFVSILINREINVDYDLLANFSASATLDSERRDALTFDERSEKCQGCVNDGMTFIKHIFKRFEQRHPPQKIHQRYSYYLDEFDSHCGKCALPYERQS